MRKCSELLSHKAGLPEENSKGRVGSDRKLAHAGFPQGVFQTNRTYVSATMSSWWPTR